MGKLYQAIRQYTVEHEGELPIPSKWCDLLRGSSAMSLETFICPGAKAQLGQSSYAINEKIMGYKLDNLSGEIVLIFETNPGWNKSGGPELLSTENHDYLLETKRCGILYANGNIIFIQPEAFDKLIWDPCDR